MSNLHKDFKNKFNKKVQPYIFNYLFTFNNDKNILIFLDALEKALPEKESSDEDIKLLTKYFMRFFPKVYIQKQQNIFLIATKLFCLTEKDILTIDEYITNSNFIKGNLD